MSVAPAEVPPTDTGKPPSLSVNILQSNDGPVVPLDLEDGPHVRTKLRLWAILLALYVTSLL